MKKVLVASVAAHVAVFALLAHTRVTPAVATAPLDEIELDLPANQAAPEPMPAPTETSDGTQPEPEKREVVASVSTRGGGFAGTEMPAPAASTGAAVEPIAGSNSSWVVNPFALGAGASGAPTGTVPLPNGRGGNPFGPTRQQMEAEERAFNTEKRKDSGLKGALAAQDARKGLGPDGPVLRALEEETRSSLAPDRGSATFRAIVDATGTVTALNLLDSTGDRGGWNEARERAFAALQKKKLEMRGTNGAMIDITVESELRYPSGQKAGGGPSLTSGGVAMGDLSDIGSRPQRVVHARLSNYTPL